MLEEANQPVADAPVEEAVKETPKDIPAPGAIQEPEPGTDEGAKEPEAKQEAAAAPVPDAEDDDGEPKKLPGSQRLKRRLAQVASDYAALAERNAELERRLSAGPTEGKPGVDRPPTEADYPNDYLAYDRA